MKPFDENLANNVREAFDNWREQVPDGAWADMRTKLDGAKQPKVVAFWSNRPKVAFVSVLVAASVALLMIPVLMLIKKTDHVKITTAVEVAESQSIMQGQQETFSAPSIQQALSQTTGAEKKKKPTIVNPEPVIAVLQAEQPNMPAHLAETNLAVSDPQQVEHTPETGQAHDLQMPEKEKDTPQVDAMAQHAKPSDQSNYNSWLPASAQKSRFSWAVSASPMVSFAQNQPNPLPGVAAGVAAGYKISDRVRIEVGGLLAYNQLDVRNEATFSVVENFTNIYASQDASAHRLLFSGNNKYNLLALEIPANIQFNIYDRPESRLFISTGLSSLVFLHQSVSGVNFVHVQNDIGGAPSGSQSFSSTTVFVDENYGPFSRIDLGRILNLSAGYVIVGKNSSLVFEPFLKLPLGGVSSSNLSLGMGGVSLKLLFSGN